LEPRLTKHGIAKTLVFIGSVRLKDGSICYEAARPRRAGAISEWPSHGRGAGRSRGNALTALSNWLICGDRSIKQIITIKQWPVMTCRRYG